MEYTCLKVSGIRQNFINVLELKAIELGIYTYCQSKTFFHVTVMCDNVTAIVYINNICSVKSETCNNLACWMCSFYIENKFLVIAAHIPGKNNIEVDQ